MNICQPSDSNYGLLSRYKCFVDLPHCLALLVVFFLTGCKTAAPIRMDNAALPPKMSPPVESTRKARKYRVNKVLQSKIDTALESKTNAPQSQKLPPPEFPPSESIPQRLPVFSLSPSEESALGRGELTTFFLKDVRFVGNEIFAAEDLRQVVNKYLGRHITIRELQQLRLDITLHYINYGYINSGAIIPDQAITDGIILIAVVEGKLTDIRVEGNELLPTWYYLGGLAPAQDRVLDITAVNKRLDVLRADPLVKNLLSTLEPGSRLGEATLVIRVEENDADGRLLSQNKTRHQFPPSVSVQKTEPSRMMVSFDGGLPAELNRAPHVSLNGTPATIEDINQNEVTFLGIDPELLQNGINILSTPKREYLYWLEKQRLRRFETPYKRSYAVLIAIDDYDRERDPKRGPTGYRQLSMMVQHAEELRKLLETLGFPPENIITLYNQKASLAAIEETLGSFWEGGPRAEADRLFVYFGGHGDVTKKKTGYLVTYDHQVERPTRTNLLMRDLTDRQFHNLDIHHVLVAVDACSSGLALPSALNGDLDEETLRRFRKLSIIRADTSSPARNILVAGTRFQEALWENGGIFTKALVQGLRGPADMNKDGIVQFNELALYVRNRVTTKADMTGTKQVPQHYHADYFGSGNFLFIR